MESSRRVKARGVLRHGGLLLALAGLAGACGGSTPPPNDQSDSPPLETETPSSGAQAPASSQDVQRGIDALQAGDAQGAKTILEQARAKAPKDPQAAFYLAVAYETLGDGAKGIELYREALQLDPKLTEAYVNLSSALLAAEQAPEAADVAGRGLKVSPNTPDLLTNHALALEAAGRNAEALEAYVKAVEASKNNAELRYTYAEFLAKQNQPDKAKEQLVALGAQAQDAKVLAAAANLFGQLKDFEQCVAFFGKAIAKDPVPAFYVRRGVCQHGRKDEAAAAADYEKALASDPNMADAHYYLGLYYEKTDKKKACEHLLGAAGTEGPYAKRARERADKLHCK
jgi:Tfp pilus assembly protein PilF